MSEAQAWLGVLATEQVAAFGYGTLGPRLTPGPAVALARACEQAHQDRGDQISAVLVAQRVAPNAPADYRLPIAAIDDKSARKLAARLEDDAATGWRYLLAELADAVAGDGWPIALAALTDSAVRAVRWRALDDPVTASVAFPGI
jgi:hypothetical protein